MPFIGQLLVIIKYDSIGNMSNPVAEIARYLTEVATLYRAGNATEHSYRPALKSLFENITAGLTITNEPKHIAVKSRGFIYGGA